MLIGQAEVQHFTEHGLQNCWNKNKKVLQSASLEINYSSVNCVFCHAASLLLLPSFTDHLDIFSEVFRIYLRKTAQISCQIFSFKGDEFSATQQNILIFAILFLCLKCIISFLAACQKNYAFGCTYNNSYSIAFSVKGVS